MGGAIELRGPDLEQGADLASFAGKDSLLGHAGGEPVLVVRRGEELFAIGAVCTHYSGSLADGIVVGDNVVCPLHHACFNLRSGEASAPAFNPVPCWKVEQRGDTVFVRSKLAPGPRPSATPAALPKDVVIIGGGAAGHAAAETLRKEGYQGRLTLISSDTSAPYDRTNVSKDYLAGTAPEEWMPMRPDDFYKTERIDVRLGARVTALDPTARTIVLHDGETLSFDALLLATGAEPIRLSVPGHDRDHVHTVRTLADSRAIIARLKDTKRAVVVGASFIGLEVAAALRARRIDVRVVAPSGPLERVLGKDVGDFVRGLHETHGVKFHIGPTATGVTSDAVTLSDGTSLPADLVVVGIGVKPALDLAATAGLQVDRGVVVDRFLQTSAPGIFAAGDIARWPDARTGSNLRVEHWVVAQRQGHTAGLNILGRRQPFADVPFFWSQHYDVAINYIGHAEAWDHIEIEGSLKDRNCAIVLREAGRIAAVATIGRDHTNLKVEAAMARGDQAEIEALVRAA